MNLINLHCFNNASPSKVLEDFYINADYIVSFYKDPNSKYTEICDCNNEVYYVKESPIELVSLINKVSISKSKTRKESQRKGKTENNEVADSINGIQKTNTTNCCKPVIFKEISGDEKIASYKPARKRNKGKYKLSSKKFFDNKLNVRSARW